MDTVDKLRDEISDTESLLNVRRIDEVDYQILRNQLIIMDALKELLEDKDKPTFGKV